MNNLAKKQLIPITIILLLLFVCSALGIVGGRIWQYSSDSGDAAAAVARRLSVDSDWDTIRTHVFCDLLVIGQSRGNIEEQLVKVGLYTLEENPSYPYVIVSFDDPFTAAELSNAVLWFDENGNLESKFRGTALSQTEFACP